MKTTGNDEPPYDTLTRSDKSQGDQHHPRHDYQPDDHPKRGPHVDRAMKQIDIERQEQSQSIIAEHDVATRTKWLWLGSWFFLNLALTMSNKAVLAKSNTPWLLTTVHAACSSMGCYALVGFGSLHPARLSKREAAILGSFSLLFTLNIAISNISLGMVSVPLHQVMRSICPVVTVLAYRMLGRTYSTATYISIFPLVVGVGIATIGDYHCTVIGFVLTLLGVILAAVKTVATNLLMTGSLKLGALELLLYLSPLATIQCVICALLTGEVQQVHLSFTRGEISREFCLGLVANGLVALMLNTVSFQANKLAGALTMTIAGNTKQALTILLGIVIFQVHVGLINGIGIAITLAGAWWYSKIELARKQAIAR